MRRLLCWRKKLKAEATRTHDADKTLSTCNETPNAEVRPTSMHELDTVSNVGSTASQAVGDVWDTHQSRDLWDTAYNLLMERKDGQELMKSYEKNLLSELQDKDASVHASNSLAGFDKEGRMSELITRKLDVIEKARWTFNVGEKTMEVKAQVDRTVKAVLYAKDFVSSAFSSDPHATLAWAGVCVLLPVDVPDIHEYSLTLVPLLCTLHTGTIVAGKG